MARRGGSPETDEEVRRSVGRWLGNAVLLVALLAALVAWSSLGWFTLRPGEAAILLRLGRHAGTLTEAGFHVVLPPPIVLREIVNVSELRNVDFGFTGREGADTPRENLLEASMQTSDNNIVRVSFAVQYRFKDAFLARYRLASPESVVRDAAQAAMREIVGRETVDGVLRERRGPVTAEAGALLQDILDAYEAGIDIQGVQLQDVQAPAAVRAAFDDVVSATQDASRLLNEAEGYGNEVVPAARGQAAEIVAVAEGYREARIADATGAASRFNAILVEYRKAPEVTRRRLYIETLESVLADAEKVIVEPGTSSVLPYLPIGRGAQDERP